MSCIAPVPGEVLIRSGLLATSSHTSPWAALAPLCEREVLELRLGAEEREDGERAGDVGVADGQRRSEVLLKVRDGDGHVRLLSCRQGGRTRAGRPDKGLRQVS